MDRRVGAGRRVSDKLAKWDMVCRRDALEGVGGGGREGGVQAWEEVELRTGAGAGRGIGRGVGRGLGNREGCVQVEKRVSNDGQLHVWA